MSQYYVIIRAEYYNPEENDARFWKLQSSGFLMVSEEYEFKSRRPGDRSKPYK